MNHLLRFLLLCSHNKVDRPRSTSASTLYFTWSGWPRRRLMVYLMSIAYVNLKASDSLFILGPCNNWNSVQHATVYWNVKVFTLTAHWIVDSSPCCQKMNYVPLWRRPGPVTLRPVLSLLCYMTTRSWNLFYLLYLIGIWQSVTLENEYCSLLEVARAAY